MIRRTFVLGKILETILIKEEVYIILNVLLLIPVCFKGTDIYSKQNFQIKIIRNELFQSFLVRQFFSQARNNPRRRKYQIKANHLVRTEQFSTECHRKSKTKVITTTNQNQG